MSKNLAVYNWIKQYSGVNKLFFNFGEAQTDACIMLPIPSDFKLKKYIEDSEQRVYVFAVSVYRERSELPYVTTNITALDEVQAFMDWIEEQDDEHNLPNFGENCTMESVQCLENMPSTALSAELAKYMFQVQIKYLQKG